MNSTPITSLHAEGSWQPISYIAIQQGNIVRHVDGVTDVSKSYGMPMLVTDVKRGASKEPIHIRARAASGTQATVQPPQRSVGSFVEYLEVYAPDHEEATLTALSKHPVLKPPDNLWDRYFSFNS